MRCSSLSFSHPDWKVFASPPPPLKELLYIVIALAWVSGVSAGKGERWKRKRDTDISARMCVWCHASKVVTFTKSRYHLQIVLTITKCLSRNISGIFVCYSLSIWVFLQSYKTADSPNSQYIEFSIEVFSSSPAATQAIFHNREILDHFS